MTYFSFVQNQNIKKLFSAGYPSVSRNFHRMWISLTDWLSSQPSSLVNLTSFALWKECRFTFILSVNVHCNKALRWNVQLTFYCRHFLDHSAVALLIELSSSFFPSITTEKDFYPIYPTMVSSHIIQIYSDLSLHNSAWAWGLGYVYIHNYCLARNWKVKDSVAAKNLSENRKKNF